MILVLSSIVLLSWQNPPNILVKFGFDQANPGQLEKQYPLSLKSYQKDTVWALVNQQGLYQLEKDGYEPEVLVEDYSAWIGSLKQKGVYHTYSQVISMMQDSAAAYSNICRLDTLGFSVEGRLILAWRITDNPDQEEAEPEVRVFGNIHGDELIGCEVPLWFGLKTMQKYGSDPEITAMVDSTEIWVCPMMNPDGHYDGARYNANGVDLNRDHGYYWDGWGGSTSPFSQVETRAYYSHELANPPSLEFVFHSAAQYVNYPWDYSPIDPPDSGLIISMCQVYADSNPNLSITNGWDWYQVNGSVQDATEGLTGGLGLTIETPQPSSGSDEIDSICVRNERAIRGLIKRARWGVWGLVKDSLTGQALEARIDFISPDRISCFTDPVVGDFHKMLEPGTYTIRASAPGHVPKDTTITVGSSGSVRADLELAVDTAQNYGFRVMYITFTEGFSPAIPAQTWHTLGPPDGLFQSLGDGGEIVIDMGWDSAIVDNDDNPDIRVYEGDASEESYSVYLSQSWQGSWSFCGTGTGTQDFEAPGTGVYRYVRIVDDGGGSGSDAGFDLDAVYSYTPVGNVSTPEMGRPTPRPQVFLMQNPSASGINLGIRLQSQELVALRVYDPGGRLVLGQTKALGSGQHSLHIPLKPGVFFLRVQGRSWSKTLRAVVLGPG